MTVENRDLVMAETRLDYGADVDVRGDEYIDPYIFTPPSSSCPSQQH
jgi:hypothetical protein